MTVLVVVCMALMPALEQLYATEVGLPRLGSRYGFEFGPVTVSRDNMTYELDGIVSLTSDGELARMGVRAHDVVLGSHGNGAVVLHHALMAAERGEMAAFSVANVDDWNAGRDLQAFRTIQIPPKPVR